MNGEFLPPVSDRVITLKCRLKFKYNPLDETLKLDVVHFGFVLSGGFPLTHDTQNYVNRFHCRWDQCHNLTEFLVWDVSLLKELLHLSVDVLVVIDLLWLWLPYKIWFDLQQLGLVLFDLNEGLIDLCPENIKFMFGLLSKSLWLSLFTRSIWRYHLSSLQSRRCLHSHSGLHLYYYLHSALNPIVLGWF